jgi:hypothetical protein
MDRVRARSLSPNTVQAVPDTIMLVGHDAFQTHFTERLPVRVTQDQIHVHFEKRAHNPILREAGLDAKAGAIPWAGGKSLRFTYASTD